MTLRMWLFTGLCWALAAFLLGFIIPLSSNGGF
jgi:hypothetical protein